MKKRGFWVEVPVGTGRLLSSCLLLVLCALPVQAFELTVLHTNDTHAAYGGVTAEGAACYAVRCPGGCGGSVRLKQVVDALRGRSAPTLLLDAGDQFQGTQFYSAYKGTMAAAVLDGLGYDAFVPGNHEFDNGCDTFEAFVAQTGTPVLAANLELPGGAGSRVLPWRVVEREGRKIGLVGLVNQETPSMSSPCAEARFPAASTALEQAVAALRGQGVDVIIAVTHLGLSADRALARSVSGVDIIVGGHSHTVLSNTNSKAEGPYPLVEQSPSGEPVLIVTAGSSGKLLGCLRVSFDAVGVASRWSGEPIPVDGVTEPAPGVAPAPIDEGFAAVIEAYAKPLREAMSRPVGAIRMEGLGEGVLLETPEEQACRVRECLTGNIVADALLLAGRANGAEMALCNGGTIRSPLHTGTVNRGELVATLPYDNTVVVGDVSGRVVMEALEHGLSGYAERKGRFPMVAGLSYEADLSRQAGQRLRSVSVRGTQGWEAIDPERTYRLATNDYLAEGGDGYGILTAVKWTYTGQSQMETLEAYLSGHIPLSVRLEGRIRIH